MEELAKTNKHLPKSFGLKTFDQYHQRSDVQGLEPLFKYLTARTYKDNRSIWISGQAGVGKTHLMIATLLNMAWYFWHENDLSLRGQFRFWNYSDLCGELRQNPNDFDWLCRVRKVRFLFIDDVGVSKASDFIQEKVYSIFNYRCENELPTFVTTNLKSGELQGEFTERLTSRIKESGFWFEINGADYRNKIYRDNLETLKDHTK